MSPDSPPDMRTWKWSKGCPGAVTKFGRDDDFYADSRRGDFHRIVYAANADAAHTASTASECTWAKRCPGVVASLREGGHELVTFVTFPKSQTLRTTNTIERLHEDFRRRVKEQGSLPSEDAALILLFSLVEWADQVAQDRWLAQNRRGRKSAYGGGGVMITRAALAATITHGILASYLGPRRLELGA